MSSPPPDVETHAPEIDVDMADANAEDFIDAAGPEEPPAKKKRERREPVALSREAGKSLLPFSRVQKIIKADKDIPIVAKEATYLISLATEEFIKRFCSEAQGVAEREQRVTVQHKDLATVVRRTDEFLFLEEIIQWTTSGPQEKRKPKAATTKPLGSAPTLLDQFVVASKGEENTMGEEPDIVFNEDGTMYAAESQDDF